VVDAIRMNVIAPDRQWLIGRAPLDFGHRGETATVVHQDDADRPARHVSFVLAVLIV
jgi:hypothetical protein